MRYRIIYENSEGQKYTHIVFGTEEDAKMEKLSRESQGYKNVKYEKMNNDDVNMLLDYLAEDGEPF